MTDGRKMKWKEPIPNWGQVDPNVGHRPLAEFMARWLRLMKLIITRSPTRVLSARSSISASLNALTILKLSGVSSPPAPAPAPPPLRMWRGEDCRG